MQQIPKIIHYCWFGNGDLSETAKRCLASWRRYAPDYEVRRCDESSFDVNSHPWTKAAYQAGKYAYVADYARFWLLHQYGGVYMDLGSELIKDITGLIASQSPFSAIEEMTKTVNAGLVLSSPSSETLLVSVLEYYDTTAFSEEPDFLRKHTVNNVFTRILEQKGFVRKDVLQHVAGWTLLPSEAFNPVYGFGGYHIANGTYSVHHFSASWVEPKFRTKKAIVDRVAPFIGRRPAQIVGRVVAEFKYEGLLTGFKNLYSVGVGKLRRRDER